jgi:hypothetical protein
MLGIPLSTVIVAGNISPFMHAERRPKPIHLIVLSPTECECKATQVV